MALDFNTVTDTDKIDLHATEIALIDSMVHQNDIVRPHLEGMYRTVDIGSAMQGKIRKMGGVELKEKTGRKETVPNTIPNRSNRWISAKPYWQSMCFDGKDLRTYSGDPGNEFATELLQAFYWQHDVDMMRAACGLAMTGDYCAQRGKNLGKCQIMKDDGQGLTPDKLRQARKMLASVCPGGNYMLAYTDCQMIDLSYFDDFKNGDCFAGGNFLEDGGIGSKSWLNIMFKEVPDRRIDPEDCCLKPAMKVDYNFYGPGKHRRWLVLFKPSAMAMTQPEPPRFELIPGKYQKRGLKDIVAQFEVCFGFSRIDDCSVVLIPVCEENCYIGKEECC